MCKQIWILTLTSISTFLRETVEIRPIGDNAPQLPFLIFSQNVPLNRLSLIVFEAPEMNWGS